MAEQNMSCPVCGHHIFSDFLKGKDYFLSGEDFRIIRCDQCGFMITDPIPEKSSIGKYYESKEYISHDSADKTLISQIYKLARFFTIRAKYRLVKKYSTGKKLLDIGCGTGEFLNFCKEKGYHCTGIEPNTKAREFAGEKYKLKVNGEILFTEEQTSSLDCITMWHVLEHIHDLNGTLALLRRVLKPSGILILALPNPASWDAKHYREHWAAFDLPRHLYHFSAGNVITLGEKHGFTLKKILPQHLDAFYISMLSEKYRSGKKDPVKGFWNGLRSNFQAPKPSFGYSSHIYVLSANFS